MKWEMLGSLFNLSDPLIHKGNNKELNITVHVKKLYSSIVWAHISFHKLSQPSYQEHWCSCFSTLWNHCSSPWTSVTLLSMLLFWSGSRGYYQHDYHQNSMYQLHQSQTNLIWKPGGSDSKESACNAGDAGSIPGLGKSPGEGNPLQNSCLENSMDKKSLGRLQLMGSQRVRHDWVIIISFHFQTNINSKFKQI